MIKKITIIAFLVGILLLGSFLFEQPEAATAQANPIVYNLYATDGYVTLADGTVSYIYGFIGGRQNTTIQYLDRVGALKSVALPDPTGGPITAAELPLAGNAQFPAPVIYASTGDVVESRLKT